MNKIRPLILEDDVILPGLKVCIHCHNKIEERLNYCINCGGYQEDNGKLLSDGSA